MTETKRFILRSPQIVRNAVEAVINAPEGWTVTVSPPKRSLDQNAKLWAMIHDLAAARPEGRQWTPEVWKSALMNAVGHQVMFAEGLEGTGPFPIGFRSSNLKVHEMSRLIEYIYEYGAKHGVEWTETKKRGFWDE